MAVPIFCSLLFIYFHFFGVTFLVRISQFSGIIFHGSGSSHFSGSKKIAPHFSSHLSGLRKKEPSYLILDLVKILLLNTFLQIFHVDNIQFMFCLRFSSKIFKTITNINSISYNFLFFSHFFQFIKFTNKTEVAYAWENQNQKRSIFVIFFKWKLIPPKWEWEIHWSGNSHFSGLRIYWKIFPMRIRTAVTRPTWLPLFFYW